MSSSIRVAIIDDSKVCRMAISSILEQETDIEIVGMASDGIEGLALVRELKPDLVIMDIFMPKMDGVETTRAIMQECPIPIIVVSSSTNTNESAYVFEAIEAGALTLINKPEGFLDEGFGEIKHQLVQSVRALAAVHVVKRKSTDLRNRPFEILVNKSNIGAELLALGSSTGGPYALQKIISQLPENFPLPIVITQHITKGFLPGLIKWLQHTSSLKIQVAQQQQPLHPGSVYFAADNFHLLIKKDKVPQALLDSSEPLNHFKPSINKMFYSVATSYPAKAIGGLLTGMGHDGADGLLKMKLAGCATFTQSKATSAIYGMPAAAMELHATDQALDLDQIPKFLATLLENGRINNE